MNIPIFTTWTVEGVTIRAAFWLAHPVYDNLRRSIKRQNDYPCDLRTAWVDYVDHLARGGEISEELAGRVTL